MKKNYIDKYIIDLNSTLYQALTKMDEHHVKFLVAVNKNRQIKGTLTDGDVRRGILRGIKLEEGIESVIYKTFTSVRDSDGLQQILSAFIDKRIEFLPVLDSDGQLRNIITRRGLHVLLLQNQKFQIDFDFDTIDENALEYAIFARPWGFYKTTVLSDMFQAKVIHVLPGQAMSLQSHQRREECWVIINGEGLIQLSESVHPVTPGRSYFIPKGCKHRLTNTSEVETLILIEVQLGDYFGEDDIIRYNDMYERK